MRRILRQATILILTAWTAVCLAVQAEAAEPATYDVFRRDNLVAWCIVPFDAKKRGSEERAAMLEKLGFKHFAYDYRAEHVPTFEAEIEAAKRHGVSLDAWWFPRALNDEAKHILALCKKHDVHPQLWITGGGEPTKSPEEQRRRVAEEAARIRPLAEAAAAQGLKVALYNHGGWFGEPENQLAIIDELKLPNVGIVYNFHHGHAHVERLAEILRKTLPHLLCLNLNGMNPNGDQRGQKILQLGQGELDLKLLKVVRESGYRGPIGILGHTQDDAEARLQDNLDGLDWLLPQLDGKPAGPKPTPRTPVPGPKTAATATSAAQTGYSIAGRTEYQATPLTIELRATLRSKSHYNILAACNEKRSPLHWEVFTFPQSGAAAVYLPGRKPDHVRSQVDVCDGKPHEILVTYAADRVRLFVDGRAAGEEMIATTKSSAATDSPGQLAVGRLVEGTIGCDGVVDVLRLSRGDSNAPPRPPIERAIDKLTLGLWQFGKSDAAEVADLSHFKNTAKRAVTPAAATPKSPTPPPGVHLKSVDPGLKVILLDRSPDQVYMGVKVDRDGHVFVGGREGVFVFEARPDGGFAPRREILRFPQDSIIIGLEFLDDDLFVLTSNALYRVPQGRVRRVGLKPNRVLWGLPLDLHVSFHCLVWGKFGDLYITHGDPWLGYGDWNRPDHWGHWVLYSKGSGKGSPGEPGASALGDSSAPRLSKVGSEWRETPYTGQGAVLRFHVATGQVDVVATGLRGPVGLAFDRNWNLFTNDNDHEGKADLYAPAKLLHVAYEGIDFGWPRGWMASKSPDRLDLNEPVCDLGRGVPCDLTYYGTAPLLPSLADRLLMCRWDRHAVTAYRPQLNNDHQFRAVEETVLTGDENCRPVGVAVGSRGELFVTALYMSGNMAAPYCASDLYVVRPTDGRMGAKGAREANRADTEGELAFKPYDLFDDLEVANYSPSADEGAKRRQVVQIGERLTRPAVDDVPPPELSLFYQKESSFFKRKQRFWGSDDEVDLADLARVGSYTMAQRWAAVPHTKEQEKLFAVLVAMLADPTDSVRLQAAFYLSLLNDSRSEPVVAQTRREIQLKRLAAGPQSVVRQAWIAGPFDDGGEGFNRKHIPEHATLDLTASYGTGAAARTWQEAKSDDAGLRLASTTTIAASPASWYLTIRAACSARQQALLSVAHAGPAELYVNSQLAADKLPDAASWVVDLQPGGNEILLRVRALPDAKLRIRLQAATAIELSLPEKLGSAELAARLREAATSGGAQPIGEEFLSPNWTVESAHGNAGEGRRLFGTLGCAKCHAIVPDQKSAGAPSLFEAKRRFQIAHLVESILLPSRQVAEPFRAQQFTTEDGLTHTGLVTAETADDLELLLPDASRRKLKRTQIEGRTTTTLSPMPQGLVKTPDELRHLLAYLLSDRPTPP